MRQTYKLKIKSNGDVVAIYDDRFKGMLEAMGQPTITRASYVEPDADGNWVADMSPVGGPRLLACALREEALAAERKWLEEHLFHSV